MAELQICLLGIFEVCKDFAPIHTPAWRTPWAPRLLKLLLVMRPDPVLAAEAVQLIGHGITPGDIPFAVEQIGRVLAPNASVELDDQQRLTFRSLHRVWIDLDALQGHFESGVQSADRGEMLPAIMAFQEADALYQGDLLEDVQEPWVQPLRRRLQARYIEILERLAEGHAVLARYQDAVGFCHKALAHDPLRERNYQRMMTCYAHLGDMVRAEEAYRACSDALRGAGRQVSEETVALMEKLCHDRRPGA